MCNTCGHTRGKPRQFRGIAAAQPLGEAGCTNFDWYLKEIYPGLIADMAGVEDGFKVHLESDCDGGLAADVNYKDTNANTVLMRACEHADEATVDELLARHTRKQVRPSPFQTYVTFWTRRDRCLPLPTRAGAGGPV